MRHQICGKLHALGTTAGPGRSSELWWPADCMSLLSMQIFLLEDSPQEAAYFKNCMESRHFSVTHFEHPTAFFNALQRHRPGMAVLDWMLPEITGFTALRRVRELFGPALPVIMMTCLDRTECIVDALKAGADDYLLKPMVRPILIARIEALMRRVTPPSEVPLVIRRGVYELDYRTQRIAVGDDVVSLTPKEFDLAWAVFSHPDSFIPKNDLIASVWGRKAEIAAHTFTQHIHVVRKKLRLSENGFKLAAVYGAGYRLESSVGSGARPAAAPTSFDDAAMAI
jgi:DNA-binding response OmpR family regulator